MNFFILMFANFSHVNINQNTSIFFFGKLNKQINIDKSTKSSVLCDLGMKWLEVFVNSGLEWKIYSYCKSLMNLYFDSFRMCIGIFRQILQWVLPSRNVWLQMWWQMYSRVHCWVLQFYQWMSRFVRTLNVIAMHTTILVILYSKYLIICGIEIIDNFRRWNLMFSIATFIHPGFFLNIQNIVS